MHDADTFSYDEWAREYCQVLFSFHLCFCAGDNEKCQRSMYQALFTKAYRKSKLSCQQGREANTLELFYFLLFYRARCLQRTFSSPCSLILCNIVPYFSACASLLWHFAAGRPEPKSTRWVFSVLYYTNKVSIRLWRWICRASTMSRTYEMLLFDSDRYSAHELVKIAR